MSKLCRTHWNRCRPQRDGTYFLGLYNYLEYMYCWASGSFTLSLVNTKKPGTSFLSGILVPSFRYFIPPFDCQGSDLGRFLGQNEVHLALFKRIDEILRGIPCGYFDGPGQTGIDDGSIGALGTEHVNAEHTPPGPGSFATRLPPVPGLFPGCRGNIRGR